MDLLLDYIRMVGYTIIILTSVNGILSKKYSNYLFVGDIAIATALLISGVLSSFGNIDRGLVTDIVLTPFVTVWAVIHFSCMVRRTI
jgi:acyl-ACP thioesterase